MKSFDRRLASADPTVPDSATYEVTEPNPNPKAHPNPNLIFIYLFILFIYLFH